jgi:hypothetical protein
MRVLTETITGPSFGPPSSHFELLTNSSKVCFDHKPNILKHTKKKKMTGRGKGGKGLGFGGTQPRYVTAELLNEITPICNSLQECPLYKPKGKKKAIKGRVFKDLEEDDKSTGKRRIHTRYDACGKLIKVYYVNSTEYVELVDELYAKKAKTEDQKKKLDDKRAKEQKRLAGVAERVQKLVEKQAEKDRAKAKAMTEFVLAKEDEPKAVVPPSPAPSMLSVGSSASASAPATPIRSSSSDAQHQAQRDEPFTFGGMPPPTGLFGSTTTAVNPQIQPSPFKRMASGMPLEGDGDWCVIMSVRAFKRMKESGELPF